MNLIASVVLVLHLLVAVAICGFVLLQHGKGADMGAAFGSGSSGSVFGASGSANFLSRTTAVLALVFFVSSVALTVFGSMRGPLTGGGLMDRVALPPATAPKAVDATTTPAKAGDVPTGAVTPATAPAKADASTSSKSSEVPK